MFPMSNFFPLHTNSKHTHLFCRRVIGINPEKGTKAGGFISKRTGKVTQKKKTVNPRVSSLLKKLMDFEWDFI